MVWYGMVWYGMMFGVRHCNYGNANILLPVTREEGIQNKVDVDYLDNSQCIELLTCQV